MLLFGGAQTVACDCVHKHQTC